MVAPGGEAQFAIKVTQLADDFVKDCIVSVEHLDIVYMPARYHLVVVDSGIGNARAV